MYLSARTNQYFERPDLYGCMFTYKTTGRQYEALKSGCVWMLDNGAFKGHFIFKEWVFHMARMMPYRANCIGIVTPDVPYNALATVEKFHKYRAIPAALGYRVAFATQDGMTPDMVPWDDFETLFVGGSDNHKRGQEAEIIAREAKGRDMWVHVGRVSSRESIGTYWTWADSFDGTTFCFDGGHSPVIDKMRLLTPTLANHGRDIQWRLL